MPVFPSQEQENALLIRRELVHERKGTLLNRLNEREHAILMRLCNGLTDRQIADELVLSPHTIRWYNHQIYQKLGVNTRAQAIALVKEFPVLPSNGGKAPQPVGRPTLPPATLLFVGRTRQLAEIKQLLQTSRLLTLTGLGGIGKTQLALRVAQEVADTYADGVSFVDLAPLLDHRQVAPAIASALGILEQPNLPLTETLQRALAKREQLLVLDNFEQVAQAAPLLLSLLATSVHLNVLVTSREPLRLAGEQEYLVPPLSLPLVPSPSLESLLESEAGLFFVRQIQLGQPHFEVSEATAPVIGRLCWCLEGVPLSLELAAVRCKLFTPQRLLEHLEGRGDLSPLRLLSGGSRHAPARQRTLRDSIAWSYELLEEHEQRLLTRLAVFHGGCSLLACEDICGEGLTLDVLDGLASLVDKHLVQHNELPGGEARFGMLALIQEYARERLHENGEEDIVCRRHARYFVELAERAASQFRGAQGQFWSEQMVLEQENLRAVLSWSLSGGEVVLGIRLLGVLGQFWYGHHQQEARQWSQQFLARLEEAPLSYHPRFLLSTSFFCDPQAGQPLVARALSVARAIGDQLQTAWALVWLGYTMLAEPHAALPLIEESLTLFREVKHQLGIAQALNMLGEIARVGGEDEQAKRAYEECLALSQQLGAASLISALYQNLAFIALHEGKAEHARDLGRQGVQFARSMKSTYEMAKALAPLAGALVALGQGQEALRAQVDEEVFQARWEEGRSLTLEQAVTQALEA